MVEQKQLLSMNYYKKGKPFTGSDQGMRYRIARLFDKETNEPGDILVSVWPEPFCYEKTPKENIIEKTLPWSEEAFLSIAEYLNDIRGQIGAT
ncbi:MAG: hypothetical protein K6G83_15155 [Lachnospiraceae bacterium]|nr:hypothetical protein [Lachnospiraceae bacterium]